MSVLEASSLTLGYSDTNIIEDLNIKIPKGEIWNSFMYPAW